MNTDETRIRTKQRVQTNSPRVSFQRVLSSSYPCLIRVHPWLVLLLPELAQNLPEARVLADRVEVVVFLHVPKIAVAEVDRLAERDQRQVRLLQEGVAAGEVVV